MTILNLLMNLSVQEFRKSVAFGEVTGKSLVSCFFGSQCICILYVLCSKSGIWNDTDNFHISVESGKQVFIFCGENKAKMTV